MPDMIERYIESICFNEKVGRQMRFIAGPRQAGKTTLTRAFLKKVGCEPLYFNWDLRSTKDQYASDPYFYNAAAVMLKTKKQKWICFDEIHKFPKWKDILKDAFDSFEDKYRFIVTGSARLDLFKKSGDSLSGRFFLYRLFPVALFEMAKNKLILPLQSAEEFIEESIRSTSYQSDMEQLLKFSGFPEPLTKADDVFSSNWHEEYIDTLIRGDIRDLTKIHEVENVATLLRLLPDKVGAPLSINSIREDMNVSYNAIKNYVRALLLTYVIFNVPPYSKRLSRMISKENKTYFFDWSMVKDSAKQFENYIACELKQRTELWTTASKYKFELFFLRSRDNKETDFLITRDGKPYFLVEVKLTSDTIESHNITHAQRIGNIPLVQLVSKPNVVRAGKDKTTVISASCFLG